MEVEPTGEMTSSVVVIEGLTPRLPAQPGDDFDSPFLADFFWRSKRSWSPAGATTRPRMRVASTNPKNLQAKSPV